MPFNPLFWGRVNANENTSFIVQPNGIHVREGSPCIFAYASPGEPLSVITAPNYFSDPTVINACCAGDLILIDAIDGADLYFIDSVNSVSDVVTVAKFTQGAGTVNSVTAGDGLVSTPNPITNDGTISIPNQPLVTPGYVDCPRIYVDQKGIVNSCVESTNVVRGIQPGLHNTNPVWPTVSINPNMTPGANQQYLLSVPSAEYIFHYSFTNAAGGAGQTIPFSGSGVYYPLNLNYILYNTYTLFNPQNWQVENSGQTIRIPSDPAVQRAFYEVELQLVVNMNSPPLDGQASGEVQIVRAQNFPIYFGLGYYVDNFHPRSPTGGGSPYFKAIVKAVYSASGGGFPSDDLILAFPIENIAGPGAWTVRSGSLSIRRVGTEVNSPL